MIPDLALSLCFFGQRDSETMRHSELADNIVIPDLALSLYLSVSALLTFSDPSKSAKKPPMDPLTAF